MKQPAPDFIIIETTTSSRDEAEHIARELVGQSLAGCVQILGPVTSTYQWQSRIETAEEFLCLIKTRAEHFDAVRLLIIELHSYDVPQIIALPISDGSPGYLKWLDEQT